MSVGRRPEVLDRVQLGIHVDEPSVVYLRVLDPDAETWLESDDLLVLIEELSAYYAEIMGNSEGN